MVKKVIYILVIIILLGVFYSLGKQIYESLQVGSRMDAETEKLAKLQSKNSELKKKLAEAKTPGFIEQQARDKLNLVRAGETVMIIPQKELEKVLGEKKIGLPPLPNWQAWLKLFWR